MNKTPTTTEEMQAQADAEIKAAGVATEAELRDSKVPWPKTPEELVKYIETLVERPHDYGTCVYAMSLSALAAFYYVSAKLGVTGFQASCADMDFVSRSRGWKGPWIILKAEDALYPQYDLPARLAEAMEKWKPYLKEEAAKMLSKKVAIMPTRTLRRIGRSWPTPNHYANQR